MRRAKALGSGAGQHDVVVVAATEHAQGPGLIGGERDDELGRHVGGPFLHEVGVGEGRRPEAGDSLASGCVGRGDGLAVGVLRIHFHEPGDHAALVPQVQVALERRDEGQLVPLGEESPRVDFGGAPVEAGFDGGCGRHGTMLTLSAALRNL